METDDKHKNGVYTLRKLVGLLTVTLACSLLFIHGIHINSGDSLESGISLTVPPIDISNIQRADILLISAVILQSISLHWGIRGVLSALITCLLLWKGGFYVVLVPLLPLVLITGLVHNRKSFLGFVSGIIISFLLLCIFVTFLSFLSPLLHLSWFNHTDLNTIIFSAIMLSPSPVWLSVIFFPLLFDEKIDPKGFIVYLLLFVFSIISSFVI